MEASRERELCLLLAGSQLDRKQDAIINITEMGVNWPEVIDLAGRCEIKALVYRGLQATNFHRVPVEVRLRLERDFNLQVVRNQLLYNETLRIVQILNGASIPTICLKGVLQTYDLYGDSALRFSSDIDLLVPALRFVETSGLLISTGYAIDGVNPAFVPLQARYGRDCGLLRRYKTFTFHVDLHCGLMWGGPLERSLLAEIWAKSRPKTVDGVSVQLLSREWEFLYLAAHAFRHGLRSLKWLVDIDRLCHQPLDWNLIKCKAHALHWEKPIKAVLYQCEALFDTQVNPVFLESRQRHSNQALRISNDQPTGESLGRQLQLLSTTLDKVKFILLRLFLPSSEVCKRFPLPDRLFFLYFLLQPFCMALKSIYALWSAIAKSGTNSSDAAAPQSS